MAESKWLIIRQASPRSFQPYFSIVAVTPSGCSLARYDGTKNFTYLTRTVQSHTVQSNTVDCDFIIKVEFAMFTSGTILNDFETHDDATQAIQELQLGFLGGEWGDTSKATDYLRVRSDNDEYWFFRVIEVVLPTDAFPRKANTGDGTVDETLVIEERSLANE